MPLAVGVRTASQVGDPIGRALRHPPLNDAAPLWVTAHRPDVTYRLDTDRTRPGTASADTHAQHAARYVSHIESKSADLDGNPCGRGSMASSKDAKPQESASRTSSKKPTTSTDGQTAKSPKRKLKTYS